MSGLVDVLANVAMIPEAGCDIAELIEAAQDVIEWYCFRDRDDMILDPDKQRAQIGRLMEALARVRS